MGTNGFFLNRLLTGQHLGIQGAGGIKKHPADLSRILLIVTQGSFVVGISFRFDASASPFCAGTLIAKRWRFNFVLSAKSFQIEIEKFLDGL